MADFVILLKRRDSRVLLELFCCCHFKLTFVKPALFSLGLIMVIMIQLAWLPPSGLTHSWNRMSLSPFDLNTVYAIYFASLIFRESEL